MDRTLLEGLLILLALVEFAVFGLFWFDKSQARVQGHGRRRRIRESTLLAASLVGGLGAWFGQQLLRHKTRKQPFRRYARVMIGIHVLILIAVGGWLLS